MKVAFQNAVLLKYRQIFRAVNVHQEEESVIGSHNLRYLNLIERFSDYFISFVYFNSSDNTNIIKTSRGRPGKGKSKKKTVIKKRCALPDLAHKKVNIL